MWNCKYCIFSSEKRGEILKHYRLNHGGHTKIVPFPCPHQDCLCTFQSISNLQVHLSIIHAKEHSEHVFLRVLLWRGSADFAWLQETRLSTLKLAPETLNLGLRICTTGTLRSSQIPFSFIGVLQLSEDIDQTSWYL